jgi:hypothetical protein
MNFDKNVPGKLNVDMVNCIEQMTEEFPEKLEDSK